MKNPYTLSHTVSHPFCDLSHAISYTCTPNKMPPFPIPLHIGTDVVHLPRILRLIGKPGYLARFTHRILTPQEQSDFRRRFHLSDAAVGLPASRDMARWLAGRFAAKEAARKAAPAGAGAVSWKDVRVQVGEGGRPGMEVSGREARVSISHDADYVVATVLAASS